MNTKIHIVQLDGLRFFAVLMVMIAHWLQGRLDTPELKAFPFSHWVTLFFVLSGFLITHILLENREKNLDNRLLLKNFYIRRALRILPVYYLTLIVLVSLNHPGAKENLPWLATFTTNLYQSLEQVFIGDFSHFWSLAVEEQFYLVWPWLMIFVPRNKLLPLIVLTVVAAVSCKEILFLTTPNWMANTYLPFTCMHALGLGALLAALAVYRKPVFEKCGNAIWTYASIAVYTTGYLISFKVKGKHYTDVADEFVFAIASFFIIARAAQSRFVFLGKYILENSFVVYSGKISYAMYIFHLFILPLYYYLAPVIELYANSKFTVFVIGYVFTFTLAHFSWILIEQPINRLKEKFPYRHQMAKSAQQVPVNTR